MSIPKYQIIENDLIRLIENGTFGNGDRIYSEAEISKKYGVSSITAVRALHDLVSQGYLVREQGKGTFVSRRRVRQLVEFDSIETFSPNDEVSSEVLAFEPENDPDICKRLALEKGGYHRIVRLQSVKGVPFMYKTSYIPNCFIPADVPAEHYQSIYRHFREAFGIELFNESYREVNEIAFPLPQKVADALQLDVRSPCAKLCGTTSLSNGRIAEYVVSYKRWDYYKIELIQN